MQLEHREGDEVQERWRDKIMLVFQASVKMPREASEGVLG